MSRLVHLPEKVFKFSYASFVLRQINQYFWEQTTPSGALLIDQTESYSYIFLYTLKVTHIFVRNGASGMQTKIDGPSGMQHYLSIYSQG